MHYGSHPFLSCHFQTHLYHERYGIYLHYVIILNNVSQNRDQYWVLLKKVMKFLLVIKRRNFLAS